MSQGRVLVVDDHPANQALARAVLESAGFLVEIACDASAARQAWAEVAPDLVVMDLQLPKVDGYTLTRELRADPRLARIPVLALTAYAMPGDREKALAAGCDEYLAKPVDPDDLESTVLSMLTGAAGKA